MQIEITNNNNILKTWYQNFARPTSVHYNHCVNSTHSFWHRTLTTGRAHYSQLIHCLLLLLLCADFCIWCSFCNAVYRVFSSFAVISLMKREPVLCFNCVVSVVCLSVFCVSLLWCPGLVCDSGISWSCSLDF